MEEKKNLNQELINNNIPNYYYCIRENKVVKIDKWKVRSGDVEFVKKLSKNFFNNKKLHNLSKFNYDCESQIYV
jgi:hypothetical protein